MFLRNFNGKLNKAIKFNFNYKGNIFYFQCKEALGKII